jgi:hypothetical protein
MGILDSIQQFGSSVISGIGSIISAPFVTTTNRQPTTITGTLGNSISGLYDSAVSRIANWINPPPDQQQATPPQTIYFGGSQPISADGSTRPSGSTGGFRLPQGMGLILVAGLVGFLIFNRGRL